MASLAVSTPSPGTVHTPNTPRHGYADSWEPYSPRKSARLSEKRSHHRTPSPRASTNHPNRNSRRPSDSFSTPATSPQKKRQPAVDSIRRAPRNLTAEATTHAAASFGIDTQPIANSRAAAASSQQRAAMLPTPAKTPRKQPDAKTEAASRSVARNLFADDSGLAASGKKKKPKKYTGLGLDSFTAEDMDEPFAIFTDSRDRVPEVDLSTENPFYGEEPVASPERRSLRRSKRGVTIPGEGRIEVSEAVKRDDGILYVFRGKKIFKKFESDDDDDRSEPDLEGGEFATGSPQRARTQTQRITRSSVKPRLLFPTEKKGKGTANATTTEDEEAATDIEDHVFADSNDLELPVPEMPIPKVQVEIQPPSPATPAEMVDEPNTPDAPRFAPASPPSTSRVTRSTNKLQAAQVQEPPKKGRKTRSPFDSWRRSKSRSEPHGQKRQGEVLPQAAAASKRQRA
ncbi:hypothetical protein F4780DRAFT_736686 [Xylariomycetidae sp. FL0641]|nr:hypothetical protein F4780DRAFT_736686 [Xylariomycetidae sp. FL0641]